MYPREIDARRREIGREVTGVYRIVDRDCRRVSGAVAAVLYREIERLCNARGERTVGVRQRAVIGRSAVAAGAWR